MNIICRNCSRKYSFDRGKGHSKEVCNSCRVNKRRIGLKQKCVSLSGGCCSACGYNKSIHALEFHHLDKSTKLFPISGAHSRSWESIQKELDKCILLCANCHRERHFGGVA